MNVVARDLLSLLERKHSGDVFVTECKDGPTYGGGHVRLDGWAMKRSWTKPLVAGYEIKVSRNDFLQDNKWPAYLDMCNQLYFVCPTGLIEPTELPDQVGLLWASKNAARLYTKKKAQHRDIEIPESVWRYVLMCRSVITREHQTGGKREFWQNWLKQKKIDRHLGYSVGSALRKRIDVEILSAREENERLRNRMSRYDDIRRFLQSIDIDPDREYSLHTFDVERQMEKARQILPDGFISDLQQMVKVAERAIPKLEQLNGSTVEKGQ